MDIEENEYENFLGELIDGGHLDQKALGITKLVIDKGEGVLSSKQKYVFKNEVLDHYVYKNCARCGNDIEWSEMYSAHDNGGLCSWCNHQAGKED